MNRLGVYYTNEIYKGVTIYMIDAQSKMRVWDK